MRDPIRQLRELPWAEAMSCAGLTLLAIVALEAIILYVLGAVQGVGLLVALMTQGPFAPILLLVWAALAGVLLLTVFERLCPWIRIRIGVLWALVGSMMLALMLRSLLRSVVPEVFVFATPTCLMGIAIGVFWKGRPYW